MYKNHQEAQLLDSYLETEMIGIEDDRKVPNLHESVSIDSEGKINITINNLSLTDACDVESVLVDRKVNSVKAQILNADMNAYNTFDNPDAVKPVEFNDFKITEEGLNFKIPACSVISFVVE